ncbi:MAG TPA: hypothetical protein VN519_12765 [Bryobacteraceae bacterium]|nr:hypothetical protein [Bryobacteraceae bacterium]
MIKQLVLLQACAACLFANTYYVSPTGNDLSSGTSTTSAFRTIDRLENAPLAAGDTILFARGGVWRELLYMTASGLTFGAYGSGPRPVITGADQVSGWTFTAANVWAAPLAIAPKQVWFQGDQGISVPSPQAVLGLNEWCYSQGRLYVYSPSIPSPGSIEAAQRGTALAMDGFGNETFQDLRLSNVNAVTVFIGPSMTGTQNFTNIIWEGSPAEGFMALSGAVNIVSSIGQNSLYGIGIYGGTGLRFSNSILSGNADMALMIDGTSGPSFVQSSTITGNESLNNAAHTVNNWSTEPLTVSNSVLLPNPYLPVVWNFTGMTDNGTNVYRSPAFTARAAPFIVVPYVDDINNLDIAEAVAGVAESYGFHISFAVNTRNVHAADWPRVSALQVAGNDIVAHTRTHSDLANLNILTIQYTGTASAATLTINVPAGKIQTFLNNSATPDLNLSLSNYYSATDLCGYLSTLVGYSCSMPSTQYWFDPVNFADINQVSIIRPYTVTADPARYYPYEINGAKADIAANMSGFQATTFATPYSSSNRDVESRIENAGFSLNRNGLPDNIVPTSVMLKHLDLYTMSAELLGTAFNKSDVKASADSLVEGLASNGGILAIYAHGYDEFTLDQWNTLFSELKTIGAQCMTASQAVAYIKSHGSPVMDGSGRMWDIPIHLTPDYTPTSSSPVQGAHLQYLP